MAEVGVVVAEVVAEVGVVVAEAVAEVGVVVAEVVAKEWVVVAEVCVLPSESAAPKGLSAKQRSTICRPNSILAALGCRPQTRWGRSGGDREPRQRIHRPHILGHMYKLNSNWNWTANRNQQSQKSHGTEAQTPS